MSGDCRFIKVKDTIQEELEGELRELLRIKMKRLGMQADKDYLEHKFQMKDVWEMKSRIVKGGQMILPIEGEEQEKD